MTTATRSVAVVATRLPNIDRRALSQAWYSALHLTQARPSAAPAHTRSAAASAAGNQRAAVPEKPETAASAGASRVAVRPQARSAPPPAFTERRASVTDLSRRIETLLVRHVASAPMRPAALAIKVGDGRVQLLVRTDGSATRVVALCPAHLRERVDRALAHARFALAATGHRIEAAAV